MQSDPRLRLLAILAWAVVATAVDELPSIEDKVIQEAWLQAERSLERELSKINNKYTERSGSAPSLRNPKFPREETLQVWRNAEIFARAVDRVSETQGVPRPVSERLVERSSPHPSLDPNELCRPRFFSCNATSRYRLIDGACNNIQNPDWGMAVSRLERILDPVYADGYNSFRQSVKGGDLPSPRVVSTSVIPDVDYPDPKGTHMLMFFGQFVSHDVTSTPVRSDLDECCGPDAGNSDCIPIHIPPNDPQFAQFNIDCMECSRSMRACGNGPREQIDQNTGFIDGSQIYGSTESEMTKVRTFSGGLMKVSKGSTGPLLPTSPTAETCKLPKGANFSCFVAGDGQVSENPGLTTMHTIFMREHNRVAEEISKIRSLTDDETIFQEARRIVTAEYQNIVYDEFLKTLFSQSTMNESALELPDSGQFTHYDASIKPNILNSFAAAAMRFGHSNIQGTMNMQGMESILLQDHFNNPTTLHEDGVEPLLLGAANQQCQRVDNMLTTAVTREMFPQGSNPYGLDLAAINIQRGRDHGLAPYNDFRRRCGLPEAQCEDDLRDFFLVPEAASYFMDVYNCQIGDFDLWPAALAEKPKEEGMLGPTFSCIMALQFHRLKFGDRFFFTHRDQAGSFTAEQLNQLRKRTLASVMCDTCNIDRLKPNVFVVSGSRNEETNCDNHPKLDLTLF